MVKLLIIQTVKIKNKDINLSSYASYNDLEWFAEIFINPELAEKPAPIALALGGVAI